MGGLLSRLRGGLISRIAQVPERKTNAYAVVATFLRITARALKHLLLHVRNNP